MCFLDILLIAWGPFPGGGGAQAPPFNPYGDRGTTGEHQLLPWPHTFWQSSGRVCALAWDPWGTATTQWRRVGARVEMWRRVGVRVEMAAVEERVVAEAASGERGGHFPPRGWTETASEKMT